MKTLIISDSRKFTDQMIGLLTELFKTGSGISAARVINGRQELIRVAPELILLDIDTDSYPDMAEYIVRLAPKYSIPIIVCTAQSRMKYTMVTAGAMDVITLHGGEDGEEYFRKRIAGSIESISRAISENKLRAYAKSAKLIAIGGSTGSTNALPVILTEMRSDCPPIVCVLHMPEGYTKIYAEQLNSTLPLEVCEAKSGMYVRQGQVIIAAGARHLRVFRDKKGYFITSERGVKVCGHCPSVNVLFDSVAYAAKSNAIGVLLTGMGRDGATGMLNMKKMGGYNIVQDEETSVVYGMPKAAYDLNAADIQLPLDSIAEQINRRLKKDKH